MRKSILFFLAMATLADMESGAEVVYQNSKDNPAEPEVSYDSRFEFGDEITLEGSERWITGFKFEYYADFNPTGDETARLRFYANDGSYGENASRMPGTLLLDSGDFTLESGYKTAGMEGLAFEVPGSFTWTIEFKGLDESERAGLLIDENVEIGSSDNSFWENRPEGWREVELPGYAANYIALVTAEYGPPEIVPGSLQISKGSASLEIETVPGRFYTLEYSDRVGGVWQPVNSEAVQATAETLVLSDTGAGEAEIRFYRVRETQSAG